MPYIIDGHNLIPKVAGMSLKEIDDELRLVEKLQIFCRLHRKKVEVFFDIAPYGQAVEKRFGMVTAYFVHQGRTADNAITAFLHKIGKAAKNWVVVSSDCQVQAEAKNVNARVISSEDFAQRFIDVGVQDRMGEDEVEKKMSDEEINEWLELFSSSDSEDSKLK